MADWKSIIGAVAPTLATALGGPLAGAAVNAIGNALGVAPTEATVAQTLAEKGITPEQLAAIKQADNEFKLKMTELEIDILKLDQSNLDGARDREVKTGDHTTPRWLAGFAVASFVGLVFGVMHGVDVATGMKDTFLILVGAAITVFKDVYGYYFGSSSGSRDKDVVLQQIQNTK